MNAAPRTVNEYLVQLRACLADQDPALIQDALYDAEEHLRAEIAAYSDRSESDVLEMIMSSYGAPDEVAAAYRDTEARVTAALRPPVVRPRITPVGRFFGVFCDPRAYAGLLFMVMSLATGILYFTVTVTGLALSAGLMVLIVGIPLFLTFIGITRVLSLVECRIVEAVSGVRMPRRPLHPGAPLGFLARMRAMLVDMRTWTTLAYDLLMLPLGIVYFTITITCVSTGVGLVGMPIVAAAHAMGLIHFRSVAADGGFHFGSVVPSWPEWLDSPLGLVLFFVSGVMLITATLHVAKLVVRGHAHIAKSMLVLP
jgi:hypothetical protein